jgi:hypothetical protein
MRQAVVVLEFKCPGEAHDAMRWERAGTGPGKPFELLGRAFEIAQRETEEPFASSLAAFFRGAMISKEDVAAALESI